MFYAMKNNLGSVTVYQDAEAPMDGAIEITSEEFERTLNRDYHSLIIVNDQLVFVPNPQSPAYDWDGSSLTWVLNAERQKQLEQEAEQAKRDVFQTEVDRLMSEATAIAQPLAYANSRKPLTGEKLKRLNDCNKYIDQLVELQYSDDVQWPKSPL